MSETGEKQSKRPSLPKRFYRAVTVSAGPEGARILLDGKPIRTPAKRELALPTAALAEAVAAEWEAQGTHIDPGTMPLTRLVNLALDGVAGREAEVRADIAKYAANDLLCYRAEAPAELVRRQAEAWDPILAWARSELDLQLTTAQGIVPVTQPEASIDTIAAALAGRDAYALAALHVITTLTGSAVLALAHGTGQLSAEAAWGAAHIDEDWQISQWGADREAEARRASRWAEMQAASRLLALLGG